MMSSGDLCPTVLFKCSFRTMSEKSSLFSLLGVFWGLFFVLLKIPNFSALYIISSVVILLDCIDCKLFSIRFIAGFDNSKTVNILFRN